MREQLLLQPHGIATTDGTTGQQWDAPNGWAPLQWIAIQGLRNYGAGSARGDDRAALGREESARSTAAPASWWKSTTSSGDAPGGGGEYPLQDGFGWTNGVLRKLLAGIRRWPATRSPPGKNARLSGGAPKKGKRWRVRSIRLITIGSFFAPLPGFILCA